MSWLLMFLTVSAIVVAAAIIVFKRRKKPNRIMREGKLLKSEIVNLDGERFYVEKVAFKDWHIQFLEILRTTHQSCFCHTLISTYFR